ncbi:hypothetical protein ACWEOE_10885 [Amycolatopsis sp. NPDC004368]
MRYQRNSRETARFLRTSSTLRFALTRASAAKLARMRVLAHKDSGETAATGRLVHQQRAGGRRDRMGVSIQFSGAAVERQFGNARVQPDRFMTRAMIE